MASPETPHKPPGSSMSQDENIVKSLVETMQAMQASLVKMGERLEKAEKKDEAPKIDHKDIQKPEKYSGHKWELWSEEFKAFLRRRDKRWAQLFQLVEAKSDAPLTEGDNVGI